MTSPVTESAATAVAGVSAVAGVAAAAGVPVAIDPGIASAVALPNTGSGGHGAPSTSITFMVVAGAISALAGAFMFLMGRRRELEDDGLS